MPWRPHHRRSRRPLSRIKRDSGSCGGTLVGTRPPSEGTYVCMYIHLSGGVVEGFPPSLPPKPVGERLGSSGLRGADAHSRAPSSSPLVGHCFVGCAADSPIFWSKRRIKNRQRWRRRPRPWGGLAARHTRRQPLPGLSQGGWWRCPMGCLSPRAASRSVRACWLAVVCGFPPRRPGRAVSVGTGKGAGPARSEHEADPNTCTLGCH